MRPRKTLFIFLLGVSAHLLLAQSQFAPDIGLPYIQNYTPKDYNYAHAQNWGIAQDERGVIYVANWDGLLEYDGQTWRGIAIPNKNMQSLAINREGRMFVGGVGDAQ